MLLLLILSLPTITGCRTTIEVIVKPIILPPMPEREIQEIPETEEDFILMLSYYEGLVQEWESWALAVEDSN